MAQYGPMTTGTLETHPLTALHEHPRNPRRGNPNQIADSIIQNGQYKPLVVNRGTYTNRPYEVLAGNHSLKAMRELAEANPTDRRWQQVQAWVVDVDEERATKIVLADNRTADLGDYDEAALLELIETVDHDLDGTGYEYDDVDMLRDLQAGAPSLDDLEEEYGEPEEADFWVTIRFKVPPVLADQWSDWARGYETQEEAFEGLMDKASNYGAGD